VQRDATALSRAIKLLEEELGGLLFHRRLESSHHTDLGHMVRPYPQSICDQSTLAKRLSHEFVSKWPLKLGIMTTISPEEIVDLIANIRTRHSVVELRHCDASAKDLRTNLLAGDIEVAIYALPAEGSDERMYSIPRIAKLQHHTRRAGILGWHPMGTARRIADGSNVHQRK
jgi:DNA-binding transcriptional LysR family regulator